MSTLRNTNLRSLRRKDGNPLFSSQLSCVSAQNSPEVYRRKFEFEKYDSTTNQQHGKSERYTYGGSVTPQLPLRSQFLENESCQISQLSIQSSSSNCANQNGINNRGSRTSLNSNPFEDNLDNPIRHSKRKKRQAPLPPISNNSTPLPVIPNITITDVSQNTIKTQTTKTQRKLFDDVQDDIDINDPSFKTELKIVEDCDIKSNTDEINSSNFEVKDKILIHKAEINLEVKSNISTEESLEEKEKNTEKEKDIVEQNEENNINKNENNDSNIKFEVNIKENTDTSNINDEKENNVNENIADGIVNNTDLEIIELIDKDEPQQLTEISTLFKKVNIGLYKRQQSLNDNELIDERKIDSSVKENKDNGTFDPKPKLNDKENNDTTHSDYETKYGVKKKDFELSEFKEFDNVIKEIENEPHDSIQEENITAAKQNTVLNMRLLFDKPNPIPKPRRSRNSSNESIKTLSIPNTPVSDNKVL